MGFGPPLHTPASSCRSRNTKRLRFAPLNPSYSNVTHDEDRSTHPAQILVRFSHCGPPHLREVLFRKCWLFLWECPHLLLVQTWTGKAPQGCATLGFSLFFLLLFPFLQVHLQLSDSCSFASKSSSLAPPKILNSSRPRASVIPTSSPFGGDQGAPHGLAIGPGHHQVEVEPCHCPASLIATSYALRLTRQTQSGACQQPLRPAVLQW